MDRVREESLEFLAGKPMRGKMGWPRERLCQLDEGPSPRCAWEGPVFIQCLSVALTSLLSHRVSESHPSLAKARGNVTGLKDPARTVSQHQEVA